MWYISASDVCWEALGWLVDKLTTIGKTVRGWLASVWRLSFGVWSKHWDCLLGGLESYTPEVIKKHAYFDPFLKGMATEGRWLVCIPAWGSIFLVLDFVLLHFYFRLFTEKAPKFWGRCRIYRDWLSRIVRRIREMANRLYWSKLIAHLWYWRRLFLCIAIGVVLSSITLVLNTPWVQLHLAGYDLRGVIGYAGEEDAFVSTASGRLPPSDRIFQLVITITFFPETTSTVNWYIYTNVTKKYFPEAFTLDYSREITTLSDLYPVGLLVTGLCFYLFTWFARIFVVILIRRFCLVDEEGSLISQFRRQVRQEWQDRWSGRRKKFVFWGFVLAAVELWWGTIWNFPIVVTLRHQRARWHFDDLDGNYIYPFRQLVQIRHYFLIDFQKNPLCQPIMDCTHWLENHVLSGLGYEVAPYWAGAVLFILLFRLTWFFIEDWFAALFFRYIGVDHSGFSWRQRHWFYIKSAVKGLVYYLVFFFVLALSFEWFDRWGVFLSWNEGDSQIPFSLLSWVQDSYTTVYQFLEASLSDTAFTFLKLVSKQLLGYMLFVQYIAFPRALWKGLTSAGRRGFEEVRRRITFLTWGRVLHTVVVVTVLLLWGWWLG
jgi:hypothetical protein